VKRRRSHASLSLCLQEENAEVIPCKDYIWYVGTFHLQFKHSPVWCWEVSNGRLLL